MDYFLTLQYYSDWGLLALRVALAAIFLKHSVMKWAMWNPPSGGPAQMSSGMLNLMRLLSVVEPLAGLGMLLGLWTPVAAIAIGIVMLGAIYLKLFKWKTPFAAQQTMGWEFDLLILASAVALLLLGPGDFSLDMRYL